MNLYKKELTVQVPSKRSCVCYSHLSGTNWAYVDHVQTQALFPPPLPTPYLSPVPDQGHQESWGGGGGVAVGHLLSPVLGPNSPTALIHQICQPHLSYLMGHPSLERTPLSEPQSQRCPCLSTTAELGKGGGGYQGEEMKLGGGEGMGGGQSGKTHVLYLKYLLSEKNLTGPLHLNPTHISF
jgi:hypothetical protein